jgi:hypothetical protein
MRSSVLLMLMIYALSVDAQPNYNTIAIYANTGQTLPIGEFKASPHSDASLEIAQKESFGKSVDFGVDVFIFKHLGITAGTSFYAIQPDAGTFERIHGNPFTTESYLRDYDFLMAHLGLKMRLSWRRFSIEPSISGGSASLEIDYADAYLSKQPEGIYRTISYRYDRAYPAALITSINLYGEILKLGSTHFCIHVIGETVFMNPEISQTTAVTDKTTEEISETETTYRQAMSLFYYGVGLSVKFGNNQRFQ